MRRLLRVLLLFLGVVALLVLGVVGYAMVRWDRTFDAPYPSVRVSTDPRVIERGRYLAEGPAHCMDCHVSEAHDAELREGKLFPPSGGRSFVLPIGTFYSANITPDPETGIGGLSDEELARALRYGVRHDGRALMPFMPYQQISEEDLTAVLSYLRAQPPVHNAVPEHRLNILGKLVLAFVLKPEGPTGPVPDHMEPSPTAEYGKYLAYSVGECYGCHTLRDLRTGAFVGPPFGGGLEIEALGMPGVMVVSPNLTPDPETGRIAKWTEDAYVARMSTGIGPPGTHMSWSSFGRMTEDDHRAVYRFLRSVPPVHNDTGPSFHAVLRREERGSPDG